MVLEILGYVVIPCYDNNKNNFEIKNSGNFQKEFSGSNRC